MGKKWKQRKWGESTYYERAGMLGRHDESGNAHEVRVHYNYNGSGDQAFGGARQWPVVSARIALVEGQEEQAKALGLKLRKFIDAELATTEGSRRT